MSRPIDLRGPWERFLDGLGDRLRFLWYALFYGGLAGFFALGGWDRPLSFNGLLLWGACLCCLPFLLQCLLGLIDPCWADLDSWLDPGFDEISDVGRAGPSGVDPVDAGEIDETNAVESVEAADRPRWHAYRPWPTFEFAWNDGPWRPVGLN